MRIPSKSTDRGRLASVEDGVERDIAGDLLKLCVGSDVLVAAEIADQLNLDRKTIAARFRIFQRHALLKRSRGGFLRTPKFIEFLTRTVPIRKA